MVIPLVPLIVTLSVELPTVTTPLAIVIVSTLFSLIVIPPEVSVTLSVEVPTTVVAPKLAYSTDCDTIEIPLLFILANVSSLGP